MKYNRGTILQWTPKAMRKLGVHPQERMIVLTRDTVILYRHPNVLATGLYKTQDSHVIAASNQTIPTGMSHDYSRTQAPNDRHLEEALAKEFGYVIVNMRGRLGGASS